MDALMRAERDGASSRIEVDRLRVKPVVKVTGEFWAQTTEGDGNFRMFEFLEREGAHVVADPLSAWVMYLLWQQRARLLYRRGLGRPADRPAAGARWRATNGRRPAGAEEAEAARPGRADLPRPVRPAPPRARRRPARHRGHARRSSGWPSRFYQPLARGGEGHLEVAKNIYYSTKPGAHMVLSLKPFGCMPSTQSDGVQSAVVAHFKDMLFLPIETAAEGELNAHSRVQMVLVEARARAQAEFDRALASTGKRLTDIRRYVDAHPELRDPFHPVPHRAGVVGVAANFVLYVSERMDGDRAWRGTHVSSPAGVPASATQATS